MPRARGFARFMNGDGPGGRFSANSAHFIGTLTTQRPLMARGSYRICRIEMRGYSRGVGRSAAGHGLYTACRENFQLRSHIMKSRDLAVIAIVALCASGARAGITTVDFSGDYSQHHLAQFDGVATYDSSTGKLSVAVVNTTSGANGGFLTGIALSAKGPTMALENTNGFVDARNHKGVVNTGALGK